MIEIAFASKAELPGIGPPACAWERGHEGPPPITARQPASALSSTLILHRFATARRPPVSPVE